MLTPRLQRLLSLFIASAGCAVIALGGWVWFRTKDLLPRGVEASAKITEVKRVSEDSDTGIKVHYEFEVGGAKFHRTGVFGSEVGADVTEAELSNAQQGGALRIRYLPENPWINEPVSHATPVAKRALIAIAIGLALIATAVVRWFASNPGAAGGS